MSYLSIKPKQIALDWISKNKDFLVKAHDKMWGWAEVGLQEYKTGKFFADILEENGFMVEREVAGMPMASVATYGKGKPVIGIMGELDALPGISQKPVPHREPLIKGGAGHGCGHNSYAATAIGGAIAVKTIMEDSDIQGTIKCFGCPAEEDLLFVL